MKKFSQIFCFFNKMTSNQIQFISQNQENIGLIFRGTESAYIIKKILQTSKNYTTLWVSFPSWLFFSHWLTLIQVNSWITYIVIDVFFCKLDIQHKLLINNTSSFICFNFGGFIFLSICVTNEIFSKILKD